MPRTAQDQSDPTRSPDWRWKLAQRPVPPGQKPSRTKDPALADAIAYAQAMAEAGTLVEITVVSERWPDLAAAHVIHQKNTPTRWELEALLLTGASALKIARRTNVPSRVARVYAGVFYDVGDRLADKEWLLRHAVGAGPWCSTPPDEAALWRFAAVVRGLPALDLLVADHLGRPKPALWHRAYVAARLRLHYRVALTPPHRKADISGYMAQMHQTFADQHEVVMKEWKEEAAGTDQSGRRASGKYSARYCGVVRRRHAG